MTQTPSLQRVTSTPALEPTATSTPEPKSNIDVDEEELNGTHIQFWHVWSGELDAMMDSLVTEFNQENEFGITVAAEYIGNYDDLDERILRTAAAQQALPDVVSGFDYHLLEWEAAGINLVELGSYFADPIWGFSRAEQEDFFPPYQDGIVRWSPGLPFQGSAQVMYYNASWAAELGFTDPPTTPSAFREQACAAARANAADPNAGYRTGGWVANTTPSAVLSWMYAYGSPVLSPGEQGYRFHTAETERAIEFLKDLYDAGCAWLVEGDYAENEFAARMALFVTGSVADLPYQVEAFVSSENSDRWTVIAFPSPGDSPLITTYGPSLGLFASTPSEQLAAWLFIKWMVSPEVQAKWVQASHTFPVRTSALAYLQDYADSHPQWAAALEFLPQARIEPPFASWKVVRWAVGDVGTQTFRSYFTSDRIPAMLQLLDKTAGEIHAQFEPTHAER
jgi:multiple sugar transport system substrate-binding protein